MSGPLDIPAASDVEASESYAINQFSSAGINSVSSQQSNPSHLSGPSNLASPSLEAPALKLLEPGGIKILLLENVNRSGQILLNQQGYQIESLKTSFEEDELIEKIRDVHAIGIRSKTKLTAKVLKAARNLIVVGCFCIGTNQVDLQTAAQLGIPVFNSPFSNSRSVAELTIAEIICLARQITDRSAELHNGIWNKISNRCWEIRGKTLGIVGYGHIGSQLSVLAESMGMTVLYHDVVPLMAMGTARQVQTLEELLSRADFVSLHVPELPETKQMIGQAQIAQMRDGSYLINNSRGSVVSIPALIDALRTRKLAGAAIDVFPSEPKGNGNYFTNAQLDSGNATWVDDLRSLNNLILTPHIGGSTEEAQSAIGSEVSSALINYISNGTTTGSVNMPEVSLRPQTGRNLDHVRVILIHKNVPGVLREVNEILSCYNVDKQMTDSRGELAYLMADISKVPHRQIIKLSHSLEQLTFADHGFLGE